MVFLGFGLDRPFYLHRILQNISKFYQCPNQNPETSLFHRGLICTLVEFHLASVGYNWENFLVRNRFLSQGSNPIVDITQDAEDILPPQTLPHEVQIEIQLDNNLIPSPDDQINALPIARKILKKKECGPKKSLETILTSLKDRLSNYVDHHSQPTYSMIKEKFKKQSKRIRQSH
jgi:hypothetical protein